VGRVRACCVASRLAAGGVPSCCDYVSASVTVSVSLSPTQCARAEGCIVCLR
jgi:hypothetical protein